MSLIHWWPLTEDKLDRITGLELNSASSTFVEGKIGKALQLNSKIAKTTNPFIGLNDWSISFWLRDDGSNAWSDFICFSKNLMRIELDNASNWRWYLGNASTSETFPATGHLFSSGTILNSGASTNTWYHVAIVKNGTNAQLYINSILKTSTTSAISFTNESAMIYFNSRANETTSSKMSLNDVRCYDHSLSYAEVKELSKALVVHYTFDDICAQPTTNLLPASQQTQSNTAATINVTSGLVNGATYTLSTYITRDPACTSTNPRLTLRFFYSDGTNTAVSKYNDGGASYPKDGVERYYFITATANPAKTLTAIGGWLMDHSNGSGKKMTATRSQLEISEYPTPYTPSTRESMLVNEAGYGGNGTLYNSNLSTDTASSTLSCHTPRINSANINGNVTTTNAAYVYADIFGYNHTPTEFTVAWWWKIINWGNGTGPFGLVISNGDYMNSTLGVHDGAVYVNFAGGNTRVSKGFTGGGTGKWTHFAITFKPGSYTSYINGVSQGTATTNASLTLDPWRYLYLGAGCAGGVLRDGNIYWSDFRYYNTCLSDNDIMELYKTKAYITDKGDIEAHQFIEDKAQAQVTSKYSFEADEFYEELYDGYDVLEYIESTGTQYVDTGYITTSTDYTYEVDITPTKIGGFYSYMGFMASGTTPRAGIHEYSSVFMLGANATTNSSTKPVVNERVVLKGHFKSGAQKLYKNGTLIASNGTTFNHSANTLSTHIFGRNYSSGRNLTSIKLYSAKIYEGSTLVRHYIPVRRQSDNVLGLYDILTNTFCANSGSGTFKNGPARTNKNASIYEDMHVSGREIIEI